MIEPLPTPRLSRHRGVVLVGGQSPALVERLADELAGPASRRLSTERERERQPEPRPDLDLDLDPSPDPHTAVDTVHRLALDLAHDGAAVDIVASVEPGTPLRPTGLMLGALLDADLGLPDGRSLLQHVVSVVSAVDLAELVLGGVDDRFRAAEHVVELVEYATVVALADTDAVPAADRRTLERLLARLAPEAAVLPVDELTRASLATRGGAAHLGSAAGWMQALSEHTPDLAHDGTITTYVYRDERPFHPERLAAVVERTFAPGAVGTVLRSRGFTQFATRCDRVGSWSSVGQMLSLDPTSSPSWHPDSPHGQQIAFFGLDLDVATIRRELDSCLLSDAELLRDPAEWRDFADPFPVWAAG